MTKRTGVHCLSATNKCNFSAIWRPGKSGIYFKSTQCFFEFTTSIRQDDLLLSLIVDARQQDMLSVWRPGRSLEGAGGCIQTIFNDARVLALSLQAKKREMWRCYRTGRTARVNDHRVSIRCPGPVIWRTGINDGAFTSICRNILQDQRLTGTRCGQQTHILIVRRDRKSVV